MSKERESQAATIKPHTHFPFPNHSDRRLGEFESAARSESMSVQARGMNDLITFFTLNTASSE